MQVGFVRAPSGRKLQPQTGFMDMMYRLIAASMLTLALGTSAIAQSSTTDTTGPAAGASTDTMMMTEADKTLTKDWSGPIGEAFFTDDSMTTLKSQAEIQSSWQSLSAKQQAQVKQDCATVSSSTAAAPGTGTSTDTTASGTTTTTPPDTTASDTTTGTGTSTDTTASTTPDTTGPAAGTSTDTTASTTTGTTGTDTTSSDMAASGAAESGTYSTAMTQLCSMVESM
jgi:hypothetical protein